MKPNPEIEFPALVSIKIKQLRISKGTSQKQFYLATQINIARLETGKYNIRIETLKTICDYFKMSLSQFFKEIGL